MIFEGLSGFPITPINNGNVDFNVLCNIRNHIDQAGLDSIGVLGSTGSFAYLSELERTRVIECWGEAKTPWIAGVSATTTSEAIRYCHIAEKSGAQGVIANAFAYVPLHPEELKRYFLHIADYSPLPLCVYDNPVTTGQVLSEALLQELAAHPNIQAIKTFAKQDNESQHKVLSQLPLHTGYAVDAFCCEAMLGGASAWYSTLAGTMPELLVPVVSAIQLGDSRKARELNQLVLPLYELMQQHSGYRVMHALANLRGWTCELPAPLLLPDIGDLSQFLSDGV
jgi:4-hydroxy-tetrahydrodipicolinate synthase